MIDHPEPPEDTAAKPSPPEETAAKALAPKVWVTGLIVIVMLLLALFALG